MMSARRMRMKNYLRREQQEPGLDLLETQGKDNDSQSDLNEELSPTTANRIKAFQDLKQMMKRQRKSIAEIKKEQMDDTMERHMEKYKATFLHPRMFRKLFNKNYSTSIMEYNFEKKLMDNGSIDHGNEPQDGGGISGKKLLDFIVVNHEGTCYRYWNAMIVILQIVTSYIYYLYSAYREEYDFFTGNFFEIFFLLDILVHFLLDYYPSPTSNSTIRDPAKIAVRYAMSLEFFLDLLPTIPFQLIELDKNKQNVFYIIKTIRMVKGINQINISHFMQYLKERRIELTDKAISNSPELGEDRLIDHNQIEQLLFINFSLKTGVLFLIIVTFSYIFAMSFSILLEFEDDLWHFFGWYVTGDCQTDDAGGFFQKCYGFSDRSIAQKTIVLSYFSFTSLSTVGFGDYNPKSNVERLIIAFFLLFGVAIFSYIMGRFIEILQQLQDLNADLDQGEELNQFLSVLVKFNLGNEIDKTMKKRIETFFDFKWQIDKNFAFHLQDYSNIVSQLPFPLKEKIYFDCLFYQFWKRFQNYFEFRKPDQVQMNENPDSDWKEIIVEHRRYILDKDFDFRSFMLQVMMALEPISYERNEIISDELDEVTEILIIMKGITDVGYQINSIPRFVLRHYGGIIGDYFVTFSKRSMFIIKTHTYVKGFFIRKKAWHDIIELPEHKEIKQSIYKKVSDNFEQTKDRIMRYKIKDLQRLAMRSDYDYVLSLTMLKNDKTPGQDDANNKSNISQARLKQFEDGGNLDITCFTNEVTRTMIIPDEMELSLESRMELLNLKFQKLTSMFFKEPVYEFNDSEQEDLGFMTKNNGFQNIIDQLQKQRNPGDQYNNLDLRRSKVLGTDNMVSPVHVFSAADVKGLKIKSSGFVMKLIKHFEAQYELAVTNNMKMKEEKEQLEQRREAALEDRERLKAEKERLMQLVEEKRRMQA